MRDATEKNARAQAEKSRAYLLTAFRGLFALTVFVGHASWLLLSHYDPASFFGSADLFLKASLYQLPRFCVFGHQAVLGFFLLSGYWIHRSCAAGNQQFLSQSTVFRFYGRRLKRIYPTYLIAAAVTVAVDQLSLRNGSTNWVAALPSLIGSTPAYTIPDLVNMLLPIRFNGHFATIGTNSPLFTLFQEMGCYLLYPWIMLFFLGQTRVKTLHAAGVIGAVVALCFAALGHGAQAVAQIGKALPIWMLGAALAEHEQGDSRRSGPILLAISVLIILLTGIRVLRSMPLPSVLNYIEDWAFGFALFILAKHFLFAATPLNLPRIIHCALKPLFGIGCMSYSLYAFHFPILLYVRHIHGMGAVPFIAGITACLAVAGLNYALVERFGLSHKWNETKGRLIQGK